MDNELQLFINWIEINKLFAVVACHVSEITGDIMKWNENLSLSIFACIRKTKNKMETTKCPDVKNKHWYHLFISQSICGLVTYSCQASKRTEIKLTKVQCRMSDDFIFNDKTFLIDEHDSCVAFMWCTKH